MQETTFIHSSAGEYAVLRPRVNPTVSWQTILLRLPFGMNNVECGVVQPEPWARPPVNLATAQIRGIAYQVHEDLTSWVFEPQSR